jgi:hypothetical protein
MIIVSEQKKWLLEDLFNALVVSILSWIGFIVLVWWFFQWMLKMGYGKKVLWEPKKPEAKK